MEKDFVKVLNMEVINDDLSLNDLKGGILTPTDAEACCTDNSACNVNQTGVEEKIRHAAMVIRHVISINGTLSF